MTTSLHLAQGESTCFTEMVAAASLRLMLPNAKACCSGMANIKADGQKSDSGPSPVHPWRPRRMKGSAGGVHAQLLSSHQAEAKLFQVHSSMRKERKSKNESARAPAAAEGTATSS